MTGKIEVVYHDDGTRTMTMYNPTPANPDELVKVMEVHYTKRNERHGEHEHHNDHKQHREQEHHRDHKNHDG